MSKGNLMTPKLLVVVGATGNQGSSVINAVLKRDPTYKIRGITSDTSTAASRELIDKGLEMVVADRHDVVALRIAFKGATAIFAVTDYFQPFFNAAAAHTLNFNAAQKAAEEDEIEQGRKIVTAACGLDTLEHFIFSSVPDANAISGGKFEMTNYVGKIATLNYIKSLDTPDGLSHTFDREDKTLCGKTTVLWVGYYMENWITSPYLRPKKTGDGSYVVRTTLPPDAPIVLTATTDTGRYVAPILRKSAATQRPILALSERRTMAQMTAALASTTRKTITYQQISPEQFEIENPGIGLMLAKMFAYQVEYGFTGDEQTMRAKDLRVKEDKLTSFESFVRARDWTFLFQE